MAHASGSDTLQTPSAALSFIVTLTLTSILSFLGYRQAQTSALSRWNGTNSVNSSPRPAVYQNSPHSKLSPTPSPTTSPGMEKPTSFPTRIRNIFSFKVTSKVGALGFSNNAWPTLVLCQMCCLVTRGVEVIACSSGGSTLSVALVVRIFEVLWVVGIIGCCSGKMPGLSS